uniref:NADH dehydrogenase subunit 3 n=1 Tax=Cordax unidentatus TaxID=3021430 RepID=UPI0030FEF7EE|nr:NADH dehydrogenase subunit 3 [Cordax unidentatus]
MFLMGCIGMGVLGLSILMMMLASGLGSKMFLGREKNSPFECGFDPRGVSRLSFSLRFFLVAVIFLVFDVEIVLLLPLVMSLGGGSNPQGWGVVGLGFLGILLLGLYFEWQQGALSWAW